MAEVRVSPQAEADLEEIWLTIALENASAADKLLRRISAKLERLADFQEVARRDPTLGRPHEFSSRAAI